jgi:hypothetical protein
MENNSIQDLEKLSQEAGKLAGEYSGFEAASLKWWAAALEYQKIFLISLRVIFGRGCIESVKKHVGTDPYMMNKHVNILGGDLIAELAKWEDGARSLWKDWDFSDQDEFFQSRSVNLRNMISEKIFQS